MKSALLGITLACLSGTCFGAPADHIVEHRAEPDHIACPPRAAPVPFERSTTESFDGEIWGSLVDISRSGLFGKSVVLPLHDGRRVTGVLMDGSEYAFGGWSGWGLIDDREGGVFTIGIKDGAMCATIERGSTQTRVRKVSTSALNRRGGVDVLVESRSLGANVQSTAGFRALEELEFGTLGANSVHNLLVVYSSDFEAALGTGGNPGTRADAIAFFMNAVAGYNTLFAANGMAVTSNLIYAYPNQYPGSVTTIGFDEMVNPNDGVMDEMYEVRELVQADLGTFHRYAGATGSPAGKSQGYVPSGNQWLYSSATFLDGGLSAHEVAHSMGMAHGINDNITPHPSIPYAYGYCEAVSGEQTIMGFQGGPCFSGLLLAYSSPNAVHPVSNEPLGISDVIDGVRAMNETAPIIEGFRSGTPVFPDCDGDEILDVIEIAHGTAQDCNGNLIDDVCDISSGYSTDCNLDGIPDECQLMDLSPTVAETTQIGAVSEFTVDFTGSPSVYSELTVTLELNAKMVASSDWEVYINGVYHGVMFDSGAITSGCGAQHSDSLTIPLFIGDVEDVEFKITQGSINGGFPSCASEVTVTLEYHTDDAPFDINRNGVFDACEAGCSPYDISAPFGVFNENDVKQWQDWYDAGSLLADFAAPYGQLNFFDLSAFLSGYSQGCP